LRENGRVIFGTDLFRPYGIELKYHIERDPLWLRDCCKCEACVNRSSKQKQFDTTDIPDNITVKDWKLNGDTVRFTWENDVSGFDEHHETVFHLRDLHSFARLEANTLSHLSHQTYWKKDVLEKDLETVDFNSYINKDEVLLSVLQALRKYGIAFVQNVPENEQSVVEVAQRIGPLKNTFYGYTWDVRSVPDAKNVAYTHGHLGFHMDLLYMKQPPRLQFLHCVRSSAQGGASLFADSYRAVANVWLDDQNSFNTLTSTFTHFEYNNDGHHYSRVQPVVKLNGHTRLNQSDRSAPGEVETTSPAGITTVNYSPPFQGPPSHETSGPLRQWHSAMKQLRAKIEQPDMIYQRQMAPGEYVIFDNQRVLHARTAFEPGDAGKERWLRGAYLDEDPWMSSLRVLEEKYGAQQ